MYLFEGVAYDLMAAIVGVALGVAVALGMVFVLARAFASFGFDITFHVTTQSLVLAYALGVLLTLVVVAVSAWRVSVLNITAAVRNLPDPGARKRGRRRWILALVGLALGLLLAYSGVSAANGTSFLLGFSLVVISCASLATKLGVHKRVAYTTAGLAIVAFSLLPIGTFDFIADFSLDYSYFLAGGLVIVLGATWVIVYNAEPIVAGLTWMFGRIRAVAPVLKLSTAYPLQERVPHRRDAGDVHARRLHARLRDDDLRLVRARVGPRRSLRRRLRRARAGGAGDADPQPERRGHDAARSRLQAGRHPGRGARRRRCR